MSHAKRGSIPRQSARAPASSDIFPDGMIVSQMALPPQKAANGALKKSTPPSEPRVKSTSNGKNSDTDELEALVKEKEKLIKEKDKDIKERTNLIRSKDQEIKLLLVSSASLHHRACWCSIGL